MRQAMLGSLSLFLSVIFKAVGFFSIDELEEFWRSSRSCHHFPLRNHYPITPAPYQPDFGWEKMIMNMKYTWYLVSLSISNTMLLNNQQKVQFFLYIIDILQSTIPTRCFHFFYIHFFYGTTGSSAPNQPKRPFVIYKYQIEGPCLI